MANETGLDTLAKDMGAQEYWVKRLVAIILDGLVISAATYLLSFTPFPRGPFAMGFSFGLGFGFGFTFGLLFYLYTVLLEYFTGQTLGKMVMRLRVVGVKTKVDLPRLLIREVSKVHPLLLALDFGAGLLVEKNGRLRYLEVLSDTTEVVDNAKGPAPAPAQQGPSA